MRSSYKKQLDALHTQLIEMGALCEDAIACAVKGLLDEDADPREKAIQLSHEIDVRERDIEDFCLKLLIREQPVASDLRRITAAQWMVIDMERIGDQAEDIADISAFMVGSPVKSDVHIGEMARAAVQMLSDSVDSFVTNDLEAARAVIAYDDQVDALFTTVKQELVDIIGQNSAAASACLDLLMIAKYLERIGDHAENIAWWVVYAITGEREGLG